MPRDIHTYNRICQLFSTYTVCSSLCIKNQLFWGLEYVQLINSFIGVFCVAELEVSDVLFKLYTSKGSGSDKISPILLKKRTRPVLTILFNLSLLNLGFHLPYMEYEESIGFVMRKKNLLLIFTF
jgi:hypothetical protein